MKKLLLTLGAVASVAAPVAAVVACGSTPEKTISLADAKAEALTKLEEISKGNGITPTNKAKATTAINDATTVNEVDEAFQTALDTIIGYTTDKTLYNNKVTEILASAAISDINAIATNDADKLAKVNKEINEFVHADGFGILFDESNQQKEFEFITTGYASKPDTSVITTPDLVTYSDTSTSTNTNAITKLTLLWKQIDTGGNIYAFFNEKQWESRGNGQATNTFEDQLKLILAAAWAKLAN